NPVILYQSIEEDLGDLGNATLGAGGYWIPVNGLKIYGQFLLDEFDFSDYTKTASNQWTKKYALLAGFAYTSLPSSTVKLEFSQVRPFTYSHHSGQTSYTHYNDYLGHPLGSNFRDITLWYHWYAPADLNLYLTASYTKRGRNSSINYGGSPLNPYTTRVKDADVQMFDGVTVKELWSEIRLNKELLPNCFIEFNLNLNRIRDAEKGDSIKLVPMIQLRWGQVYRNERY
ncbi:MAG TPA: capsule assembly Wzi family protein, partial [Rhodothermales bacterium]|nr:capsule assembly Wzi family protein [Rhodothermales bacterium]